MGKRENITTIEVDIKEHSLDDGIIVKRTKIFGISGVMNKEKIEYLIQELTRLKNLAKEDK